MIRHKFIRKSKKKKSSWYQGMLEKAIDRWMESDRELWIKQWEAYCEYLMKEHAIQK